MGDEEEFLGDSTLRAATNIKGKVESWEDYAGFMAANGQTFNWVPFNGQSLASSGAGSGSELGFGSLLLLPVIDKKKKDQKMGDF